MNEPANPTGDELAMTSASSSVLNLNETLVNNKYVAYLYKTDTLMLPSNKFTKFGIKYVYKSVQYRYVLQVVSIGKQSI